MVAAKRCWMKKESRQKVFLAVVVFNATSSAKLHYILRRQGHGHG